MNRVDYRASSSQHKAAQSKQFLHQCSKWVVVAYFLVSDGVECLLCEDARHGRVSRGSFIRSREKRIQHHRSKLGNGEEKEIQSNRYTDLDLQTRFVTVQLLL